MENIKNYGDFTKEHLINEELNYKDITDYINRKLDNLSDKQKEMLKKILKPFMGKSKEEIQHEIESKIGNIDPYNEEEWNDEKKGKIRHNKRNIIMILQYLFASTSFLGLSFSFILLMAQLVIDVQEEFIMFGTFGILSLIFLVACNRMLKRI